MGGVRDCTCSSLAGLSWRDGQARDGRTDWLCRFVIGISTRLLSKMVDCRVKCTNPLLEFNTLLHEQSVAEFKNLDLSVMEENRNILDSQSAR